VATDIVPEIAVSTWSIDPAHSSLHFKVRHMAIAWVRGEFRISKATLSWDKEKVEHSRVDAEIDSTSVNTAEPQRDLHLRSESFSTFRTLPRCIFNRRESHEVRAMQL
jgi:polyisoprenoid-binding protein YceI